MRWLLTSFLPSETCQPTSPQVRAPDVPHHPSRHSAHDKQANSRSDCPQASTIKNTNTAQPCHSLIVLEEHALDLAHTTTTPATLQPVQCVREERNERNKTFSSFLFLPIELQCTPRHQAVFSFFSSYQLSRMFVITSISKYLP